MQHLMGSRPNTSLAWGQLRTRPLSQRTVTSACRMGSGMRSMKSETSIRSFRMGLTQRPQGSPTILKTGAFRRCRICNTSQERSPP